jgi:hypothetical protein
MKQPKRRDSHRSPIIYGLVILLGLSLLLVLAYPIYLHVLLAETNQPRVRQVGLADLTGNGYLDAYLAIGGWETGYADLVLFNEGDGRFRDSGQQKDDTNSRFVRLGDINGDGQTDVVLVSWPYWQTSIFINSGDGFFDRGSYSVRGESEAGAELADLNGNGSLDLFVVSCCVWLNNDGGWFDRSGPTLHIPGSNGAALGDLNGNGFVDAFVVSGRAAGSDTPQTPNSIWFNDGQGRFSDSGQQLGLMESMTVTLADINGNGHLDAIVGNRGPDEVWLNDGQGHFSDSRQRLSNDLTRLIVAADLNGSGSPDLVIDSDNIVQVWLNDGEGQFIVGQSFAYEQEQAVAVGDVTGNGIVDIFISGVELYQVWRGVGDGRFVAGPPTNYR